jgi:hypothetical protein
LCSSFDEKKSFYPIFCRHGAGFSAGLLSPPPFKNHGSACADPFAVVIIVNAVIAAFLSTGTDLMNQ